MAHRNESNAIAQQYESVSKFRLFHINHLFTPYNTDTYHISFINQKEKD